MARMGDDRIGIGPRTCRVAIGFLIASLDRTIFEEITQQGHGLCGIVDADVRPHSCWWMGLRRGGVYVRVRGEDGASEQQMSGDIPVQKEFELKLAHLIVITLGAVFWALIIAWFAQAAHS